MKNNLSSLVYVIMAQPIKPKSPPFVLQMFGTDNKFTTQNVLDRWKHTLQELQKYVEPRLLLKFHRNRVISFNCDLFFDCRNEIQVKGISSDGDARLLSAMRSKINFKFNAFIDSYEHFNAVDIIFTQDHPHVGTKLRNRLLKPSISLPFGTKPISVTHLKILIEAAPKDVHNLVSSDIAPDDRQNFGSLQKIMKTNVLNALKRYVIGSDATIIYLKICNDVTSSFLDVDLLPIDRVSRIWNAIFLLRIWRDFIEKSDVYNIDDNFITENAYTCIELNGLALIKLIVSMRNTPELFLPSIFDSQMCEKTFRQLRSMGTQNFTKINFTMAELLHMVSRIDIQNDIAYFRLANKAEFPRITKNEGPRKIHSMPSNAEIAAAIGKALSDAVNCAAQFGMNCDEDRLHTCQLENTTNIRQKKLRVQNAPTTDQDDEELENIFHNRTENINLKAFNAENIGENSKYIQICNPDGTLKIVLKSSIVSLFADSPGKLSNDRLKRVQETPVEKTAKRQKTLKNVTPQSLVKYNEIYIGEWCVFNFDSAMFPTIKVPENTLKNLLVGSVLCFEYVDGSTEIEKQYHVDYATVTDGNTDKIRDDLNVLSSWYAICNQDDNRDILIPLGYNLLLNMKHYKYNTPIPTVSETNVFSIHNICNMIDSMDSM